jgi:hypothetical protein
LHRASHHLHWPFPLIRPVYRCEIRKNPLWCML